MFDLINLIEGAEKKDQNILVSPHPEKKPSSPPSVQENPWEVIKSTKVDKSWLDAAESTIT